VGVGVAFGCVRVCVLGVGKIDRACEALAFVKKQSQPQQCKLAFFMSVF